MNTKSMFSPFLNEFLRVNLEIILALFPILIVFLVFKKFSYKMFKNTVRKTLIGILFTFIGLVLFIVGVNAGLLSVGRIVGYHIVSLDHNAYIILIAFALGVVTILAEPAVHVLTNQIEDVTSGYVKRSIVLVTLSIGVGLAVLLSIIRVLVPGLHLWHYLLPGYLIALALTF